MAYQSIFQNPQQVVNPQRTPNAPLPVLATQKGLPNQPQAQPTTPGKMSVQEFAKSIKDKYPSYQTWDDQQLTQKFIAKYPVYADKVEGGGQITAGGEPYDPAQKPPELGFFKSLIQPELSAVASGLRGIQSIPDVAKEGFNLLTGNKQAAGEASARADEIQKRDLFGVQTFPQQSIGQLLGSAAQVAGQGLMGAAPFSGFALQGGGLSAYNKDSPGQIATNAVLSGLAGKAGSKALPYIAGKVGQYAPQALKTAVGDISSQLSGKLGQLGNVVNPALDKITPNFLSQDLAGQAGQKVKQFVGQQASNLVPKIPGFKTGAKILMGEDVANATNKLAQDPANVNAFRNGQKTFENIATTTRQAVDKLEETSKTTFNTIKDSLPGNKVPKLATQRGSLAGLPKTSELTPQEKPIITKLRNLVMNNKDWTDKGVLSLRNRIDRAGLFRDSPDYVSSNRAVTNARNFLNKAVTDVNPFMKGALDNASKDIDLLNKIKTNLVGNNPDVYVERTASKLNTIMNKLDDPTQFQATHKLIQELEARTGIKITPDLEAAHAATVLNKNLKFPGIEKPVQTAGNIVRNATLKATTFLNEGNQAANQSAQASRMLNLIQNPSADNQVAQSAFHLTKTNGGVTIDLKGKIPTKGFAYSPFPDAETIVPPEGFTPATVEDFINKFKNRLGAGSGNHIGIWEDNGKIYMDISKVGNNLKQATTEAAKANQQAIFDIEKGKSLFLKPPKLGK